MKNKRSRLGLSILAGGLSFVGAANATDLIVNGSFENPSIYDDAGNPQVGGAGWQYFSQYNHTTAYYDPPDIPAAENPGTFYSSRQAKFWGGWDNFTTPSDWNTMLGADFIYAAQQRVDLTTVVSTADIDAGLGTYTLSSWMASYPGNPEQPAVWLQFFSNPTGEPLPSDWISTPAIFDRCTNTFAVQYADGSTTIPLDLTTDHKWIKYVASGNLPVGARQAKVFISRSPTVAKINSPDSYVDLVKLDVNGPTPVPPSITTPPASQTAAAGNSVTFSVTASGTSLAYQWRRNTTPLPGKTGSTLELTPVHLSDAGSYDVVVTNNVPDSAVTSAPPAELTVMNPPVYVTGQWDFLLGNLTASYGNDLQYNDSAGQTTFGTTTSFGITNISGAVATPVMHFTPPAAQWGGYKMYHGAAPNGGGSYVNQYTLVFDIYYPPGSDLTWRSLWQTDTGNSSDGDLFVNPDNGIGISGVYNGIVTTNTWHRLAFAIDLTGTETGTATTPVIAKFIDGVKVGNQTAGLDAGMDGRWSLDPYALVFADNDGDVAEGYVSSIQFNNGRRPDAYIEAMGGPSIYKIPGMIRADIISGSAVIRWSGGWALESADPPGGSWTIVSDTGAGTAHPASYTPPLLSTPKLYRPHVPVLP